VFPECRVQPFDVRGGDHPVPWRVASARPHACRRAIHNTAFGFSLTNLYRKKLVKSGRFVVRCARMDLGLGLTMARAH
jgi:hypothetical protein